MLFIGPYDLSISLGYPAPSPDPHPEVEKMIQHIREVAQKAEKKWYVLIFNLEKTQWTAWM